MAELETIYADAKSWVYFNGCEESETIGVYRRCECGRFLKKGQLFLNGLGEIKLKGWACVKHGEVEPYFDRDIQFD